MKKFAFKLQGVLEHRLAIEEEKKRAFAEVLALVEAKQRQLDGIYGLLAAEREQLAGKTIGELDVEKLLAHRRYVGSLELRLGQLHGELHKRQQLLEIRRKALVEASRDRKALEKLKERQLEQWVVETRRLEQKALDEVALRQFRAEEQA